MAHSRDGETSDLSLIMDKGHYARDLWERRKFNMMIFSPPRANH